MTAPRCILPGRTYLLTRRCSERRFFLRPSKKLNELFLYCLAYAAREKRMRVHAFCVMSNHYHVVASDPEGNLPDFMHLLDMNLARAGNVLLSREENFWAPGSYSMVHLATAEAVVEKIGYTLANPVEAGLVACGKQWPGLRTRGWQMGVVTLRAKRPEWFFGEVMPEEVALKLVAPRLEGRTEAEVRLEVSREVNRREEEIRARYEEEGRKFVGRRGVLRQSPHERPRGEEEKGVLRPRVATRDRVRRVETLRRLKMFLAEYEEARLRFEGGEEGVVFPAGTWQLRKRYGVRCAAPP